MHISYPCEKPSTLQLLALTMAFTATVITSSFYAASAGADDSGNKYIEFSRVGDPAEVLEVKDDVPQALQTGVIDGLDHTPIVCNISKKFTVAKYYTQLDYAQGLYVHIINQKWLKQLPEDLQKLLLP